MKANVIAATVVAASLGAAGLFFANAQAPAKPPSDPRLDKLIEQNDKILKNQQEMLRALGDLKEGVLQLRRRSS